MYEYGIASKPDAEGVIWNIEWISAEVQPEVREAPGAYRWSYAGRRHPGSYEGQSDRSGSARCCE